MKKDSLLSHPWTLFFRETIKINDDTKLIQVKNPSTYLLLLEASLKIQAVSFEDHWEERKNENRREQRKERRVFAICDTESKPVACC